MNTPPRSRRVALILSLFAAAAASATEDPKPAPARANFRYGPHERQVFDFWPAESKTPTPFVLFIHGGGFRNGSKDQIKPAILRELLDAGISVAALNYRLVQHAPLPVAFDDCRRALQLLRSKAGEWNLDKTRAGAWGGSAGAVLCMYFAFHDDLARPGSADPVERESTRLAAVATTSGQTSMDIGWWEKHIPGWNTPHDGFHAVFTAGTAEEKRRLVVATSALAQISKDDPPIWMSYEMAPGGPVPAEGSAAFPKGPQYWKVHNVVFGVALKEKMDALGLEAHLAHPGAKNAYRGVADFLRSKLTAAGAR